MSKYHENKLINIRFYFKALLHLSKFYEIYVKFSTLLNIQIKGNISSA